MKYLGIFLIIVGLVIAAGYGIFLLGKGFFTNTDIGIPFRVAIPVIVVGFVVWLIAFIREKFKDASLREPTEIIMDRNAPEMDDRDLRRGRR